MPLFDFTCRACQHEFEALVRAGHQPACPECASVDLARQLPVFAVKTSGRTKAAAAKARETAGVASHKEMIAREAEAARHRHEDH